MSDWIDEEFGAVRLGDQRLNQRLRRLLTRKWENPQRSLSAACQGRAEVEAASRFFDNPKANLDKILAPHRAATLARIRQGGYRRVLLVQDTSECDYTTHPALHGAGPLSSQDRRGFFTHNLLVVTPERVPLGLWYTFIFARDDAEHGKAATRKERPIEQKESFRWIEGYREACALASLLPGCEVLCLADRESDIYELFVEYGQRRAQGLPVAELLIRSNQDRCLEPFEAEAGTDAEPAPLPPAPKKIRARLAAATVLGHVAFDVPAATRMKKTKGKCPKPVHRSARHVEQEVKAVPIRLKPPWRSPAAGGALPAVELWVVEAREPRPPAGEEPLVWVLLTTLPVATSTQAVELLELYLCRWEIELLHRMLKSGCHVEEIQLRFDFRLEPAIGLYLIVAWRLLYVLHLGRACPDLPCEVLFAECEWKPVVVVLKGRAALQHPPSVGEMVLLIAQLGGHLARKNDPPPGMKCFWQGMMCVTHFARCWKSFGERAPDTS